MWRHARELFDRLDLGIDPALVSGDELRSIRVLAGSTLALVAIAVPSSLVYARHGVIEEVVAIQLAVLAALANLAFLRRTLRPDIAGHLGLGVLTTVLLVSNIGSGGFYEPNFAWFYLVPMAAAVVLGTRGAVAWLGVVLALTVGFWSLPEMGIVLENRIPEQARATQALIDRVTALLGLAGIAASFVASQRRAERHLARANREMERESAYVQLLRNAAISANEAASLEEALGGQVRDICEALGWPAGHALLVGEDGELHATDLVHLPDPALFEPLAEVTRSRSFPAGVGLPGLALATGRPQSLHDLRDDDPAFPRAGLARAAGLATGIAVPVLVHGETRAVLEFCTHEPLAPDAHLLEVLGDVGVQLGRIEERTALQDRVRQSQKMEAVGQLAAGIAHEVNNPMSYVRANLCALREEWEALRTSLHKPDAGDALEERLADLDELIGESLEGVDRTIAIVRDVNEFSRAASGDVEDVDLEAVVEGAFRVASPRAAAGVTFHRRYRELPRVRGSSNQLRQVFVNLLVNAAQAVGERGEIAIEAERVGREVVVRIVDDGPGIPAATRERLFDPFFTTKPVGEGTGLGLYVSWEIVGNHGGTIRVDSEPGRGSTFEVRLPAGVAS